MKQLGGDFLAQGAHGCAFYPALECKSRANKKYPLGLGKLFGDPAEAVDESGFNAIVKSFDPKFEFTVPFYGKCTTVISKKVEGIDRCDALEPGEVGEEVPQLMYQYGGFEIAEIFERPEKHIGFVVDEIFLKILPVFEGISRMQKKGYCHTDIKPPNMLYNPVDGKIRLIDFGLMSKLRSVKYEPNLMQHVYHYYPMECLIISKTLAGQGAPSRKELTERFTSYKMAENVWYFLWKHNNAKAQFAELLALDRTALAAWDGFPYGIDSYSLAITLLELYCNVTADVVKNDNFVVEFVDKVLLPMVHLNPYKRMLIDDAIVALKQVFKKYGYGYGYAVGTGGTRRAPPKRVQK